MGCVSSIVRGITQNPQGRKPRLVDRVNGLISCQDLSYLAAANRFHRQDQDATATTRRRKQKTPANVKHAVSLANPGERKGGAEGTRTPDLLTASQTRSQLRHSPTSIRCIQLSLRWAESGAEGTRTPGLISAIDTLSQLSYSPKTQNSIVYNGIVVKSPCPQSSW